MATSVENTATPVAVADTTGHPHSALDSTAEPHLRAAESTNAAHTASTPGYVGDSVNGNHVNGNHVNGDHAVTDDKAQHLTHYDEHNGSAKLPTRVTRILLQVCLGLLIVDAAISVGFAASTLDWINTLNSTRRRFAVATAIDLYALPVFFDNDVTRVALAAACVALVLVGFGGIAAISLRNKSSFATSLYSKIWYHIWLVSTLLSMLLSFASIIYTFVIRNKTSDNGQLRVTSSYSTGNSFSIVRYNSGYWSPITWFSAVLDLRGLLTPDRNYITPHWRVINGWMYNQYPLFFLGLGVFFFAVVDGVIARKLARQHRVQKEAAVQ